MSFQLHNNLEINLGYISPVSEQGTNKRSTYLYRINAAQRQALALGTQGSDSSPKPSTVMRLGAPL